MKNNLPFATAALVTLSLSCSKKHKEEKIATPHDICVFQKTDETSILTICTDDFVKSNVGDGATCYYEQCTLPSEGCPKYFVKTKSSASPSEFCDYRHPTDL